MTATIELTKKEFDLLRFALPKRDPRKILHVVTVTKGKLISCDGHKLIVIRKKHDALKGAYWLMRTALAPFKHLLVRDTEYVKDVPALDFSSFVKGATKNLIGDFYKNAMTIVYRVARRGVCLDIEQIRTPVTQSLSCKVYAEKDKMVHFECDTFDFYVMPSKLGGE